MIITIASRTFMGTIVNTLAKLKIFKDHYVASDLHRSGRRPSFIDEYCGSCGYVGESGCYSITRNYCEVLSLEFSGMARWARGSYSRKFGDFYIRSISRPAISGTYLDLPGTDSRQDSSIPHSSCSDNTYFELCRSLKLFSEAQP